MIEIKYFPIKGVPHKKSLSKDNLLKQLQALVGGYVEVVNLGYGKILLVNEEGLLENLPPNPHWPPMVGNIILMNDVDLD
jgi:hypothetical protein